MESTITSIYSPTVSHYSINGVPVGDYSKVVMIDTNVWTNLAKASKDGIQYFPMIVDKLFDEGEVLIIPEIILRECAGNGVQLSMDAERFQGNYSAAFSMIASKTDIHIVTFADMEALMAASSSNQADVLTRALIIAHELFSSNTTIRDALANVKTFVEIEDAITVVRDDAGERVILFFSMLFLYEMIDVDVLTNETSVYTDRFAITLKERLLAVIGNISVEALAEAFKIRSFDSVLYEIMDDTHSDWSDTDRQTFIEQCRYNRARKMYIMSGVMNYSDIQHCANNKQFLEKYNEFRTNVKLVF